LPADDAYERLRAERPRLFANPPGTPLEIVFDQPRPDTGVVYEDDYLKLVKDVVRFPSGRIGTYIRTVSAVDGEPVVVLATAPDGRVALVRHFRHGCREWHWEMPRGFAEPGTGGPANAAREMRDELGVSPAGVELLGRLDEQESEHKVGVYHAVADFPEHPPVTAEAIEEGIGEIVLVEVAELRRMIRTGEITDLYTLGAFALAVAAGLF
jgi:ADP-ribose pyrophosphatase